MKKHLLLLTVALSCGLFSYAQVSFGVKAGFNAASMSVKQGSPSVTADTKMVPAFHAGLIADIALSENFSLQPGLFYSAKGTKLDVPGPTVGQEKVTATTHLNYLELPVNFLYKHELGPGKIFAGFGPYLAYGISGKIKVSSQYFVNREYDVKFENKQQSPDSASVAYVKPFDAGANFIAGYEFKMGLVFSVNYSLGLTNTSPYDNETEKNHYLGISVGYLLHKRK
ncbi:Outer membrane protein beta-barrel domain-containing protein [Chitinophaga rupis]|uniref:Outer membrane protein beta-barrel domain-containing protein n=1 Tax=Chitinophaga rupis TaxID=573321 RepID=A0A1H7PB60_9BACT|nr:porin family protein [Chitinophaga rupis]SEL32674.1 Outer membrane protein beta-barrel domain-containing protein [Chitinophaga rupis]